MSTLALFETLAGILLFLGFYSGWIFGTLIIKVALTALKRQPDTLRWTLVLVALGFWVSTVGLVALSRLVSKHRTTTTFSNWLIIIAAGLGCYSAVRLEEVLRQWHSKTSSPDVDKPTQR